MSETERELGVVYSRLKKGSDKWDKGEASTPCAVQYWMHTNHYPRLSVKC